MKRKEFVKEFESWETRWENFLNERTRQVDGSTGYTHRRLRSARKSVKAHLPWLFTFEQYPLLCIPNTTGRLEGVNSQIKDLTKKHSGQNLTNKMRMIDAFLNGVERAE